MKEYRINKGYRALVNAALLNGIGNSLFNIVFVIYASTLPFKTLAVSLASMAMLIPSLLQIMTGYWADKTSRKTHWMIVSRIGQFFLFVILTFAIQLPASLSLFLMLLAINIISDCLGAYGGGLQLPLLRHLIPTEELDNAMGFQMAAQTVVQIIFQGIGAWAIVLLDYRFGLFGFLNSLTFLIAAIAILLQRHVLLNAEAALVVPVHEPFHKSIKTTIQLLLQNRFLKRMILFALLINTLASSTDGLINLQLLDTSHLWFANYGNTVAIVGITLSMGIICGSLLANDWFKHTSLLQLIVYIALALILLTLNFLLIGNRWLMMAAMFATGYLMGKINPRFSAYLIREIDQPRLAVTSGIFSTIVLLGGPVGQTAFLGIANAISISLSWQIYLIAAFLIGSAAFFVVQKDRTSISEQNSCPPTEKQDI